MKTIDLCAVCGGRKALASSTFTLVLAASLVALLFGSYFVNNFGALLETHIKGTDYSLIALQAQRAKSFEVLVGPYSRFSFNHPGPMQFYVYAFSELLPVSHSAAHAICQLLINATCFFVLVILAARIWGFAVAAAVSCTVGIAVYFNLGILSDTWGPSVIFVPYLLFVVSGAAVGRCRGGLITYALAGSWIVSNHLGLLLPVILATAWVLLHTLKRGKVAKWELIVSAMAVGVFFALPIYELFLNYPLNNFQRFFRFLGRYDPTVSFADVWRALESAFPYAKGLLIVGVLSITALVISSRSRDFGVFLALAVIGHLLSLFQTVGRLHPYLFWPLFGALSVAVAVLFGSLFNARTLYAKSSLLLLASLSLLSFSQIFQHDSGKLPENYAKIMLEAEQHPNSPLKLMTRRHQNWEVMTAVADTLARQGRTFCVQERLEFIFGRDLICGESAGHVVLWFGELPQ